MHRFEVDEVETYKQYLYTVKNQNKTISDYIVIDSMSSIEKKFAEDCESNPDVEFFIKLPNWFFIPTPIGNYNPDWALIFKNQNKLYFVAETKSTTDKTKLRPSEKTENRLWKSSF
jgi:type III restriction enzyme